MWTDCSYWSSLIWVYTVCHRGFLNISADEKNRRLLLRLTHSRLILLCLLLQVLKQDIQDNKPLVDKLNKTGTALSKLYLSEDDLELVKSTVDDDNRRVEDIRRAMRDRSMSIDEALQQSAEVGLILTLLGTDGFFLLVWCSKLGMVHCTYQGIIDYNFKKYCISLKILFVIDSK